MVVGIDGQEVTQLQSYPIGVSELLSVGTNVEDWKSVDYLGQLDYGGISAVDLAGLQLKV